MPRTSVYVPAFSHANPIPAASRIGNLLMSGIIYGLDPATGRAAATLDQQVTLAFGHIRSIVEAGGGTVEDILKITVWLADRDDRAALNREWLTMFPDEASRPARQTMQGHLGGGQLIQCDFVAVIDHA